MASPVSTDVKHYRSDMPGAPVQNGLAGSKLGLLDACLVTGYGLKTATSLTVAGGVATLTFAGGASAAWPEAVILVEGATGSLAGLNGEQKVVVANTTTVTFATALPDGTAAGTITFKVAPAGWEKVFSKTNVAVYRSLHPESSKMFLRVDDTTSNDCRVVGYESMSDVDTGTGPFPTAVQVPGGGYWSKSASGSSAATAWAIVSDGVFVFDSQYPVSYQGSAYEGGSLRGFGDFLAKNPAGDSYACGLCVGVDGGLDPGGMLGGGELPLTFLARGYTGLGASVAARRRPYTGSFTVPSGIDGTMGAFPSPVDGSLILSSVYVTEGAAPRGDIPGLKFSPQAGLWNTFKRFNTVAAGSRTYLCCASNATGSGSASTAGFTGIDFIDITGPWR